MLFGQAAQLLKSGRILDRHVGKDFAIQQDFRFLESIDEPAVGQSLCPDGGTDARNPQPAKIPLPVLSSVIGILLAFINRLCG